MEERRGESPSEGGAAPCYVFHAGIDVYVVFGAIGTFLLLGTIVAYLRNPFEEFLNVLGLFILYCGAFALWICRFRIILDNETLTYRSLFTGSRFVRKRDIEKAEFTVGNYTTFRDRFKPFERLTIYLKPELKAKPIVINVKVFRLEDIRAVFRFVGLANYKKHKA